MRTRFFIALATIVVSVFAAQAATVDEIIAQFPAQDAATANSLFEQLLDLDDDALEGLCTRLVPLGAGDDNAVRYSLTGLARYVTRPGADDRDDVEEALLEGLKKSKDPECRAFLLRQLQQCGGDESVKPVARLLKDEANASHAILTLEAIGTSKSRRALAKGLKITSGAIQLQILSAFSGINLTSYPDASWRSAVKIARKRLAANPDADEQVHLLSILVHLEGKAAGEDVTAALKSDQPRVAQAASALAKEIRE